MESHAQPWREAHYIPIDSREPWSLRSHGACAGAAWALCQVRGPPPAARSCSEARGPGQPLPQPPHGDKKDGALQQQFLGGRGARVVRHQGHVSQQRWHWAAQKPLSSGWS